MADRPRFPAMNSESTSSLKFGDLSILYEKRSDKSLPPSLTDALVASDLKPGIYEGGFKIWECSIDLCRYLSSNRSDLDGKAVIELGCGAGTPGIVALKQGARHVCFQDFNDEVINLWTKRNVQLNLDLSIDGSSRCSFLVGDWDHVRSKCDGENTKFDVVLTSETIYNVDNYRKLVRTIDATLESSGYALVAAKSYYFGVGGSIDSFLDFLQNDGTFEAQIAWSSSDSAISRQIMMLRRIRKAVS